MGGTTSVLKGTGNTLKTHPIHTYRGGFFIFYLPIIYQTVTIVKRSYSEKLILRRDYVGKDGKCQLTHQITLNGKVKRFPVDIKLLPDEWDAEKQQVKMKNRKHASDLQAIAEQQRHKATEIFIRFRHADALLTMDQFEEQYLNVDDTREFVTFVKREIEQAYGKEKSTLKGYRSTLRHLELHCPKLQFAQVDYAWYKGFDKYLVSVAKLNRNTANKVHRHVRSWLIEAAKKKYKVDNVYKTHGIRLKDVEAESRFALTVQQVKAIQAMVDNKELGDALEASARTFLFMCYTGIRVTDTLSLKWLDIKRGYIHLTPQKTKKTMGERQLPFNDMARACCEEGDDRDFLFRMQRGDQVINRNLKEVARKAGIENWKKVTCHIGRHTYGTLMARVSGMDLVTLKELMCHKDIKTTSRYAHYIQEAKDKAASDFNALFA